LKHIIYCLDCFFKQLVLKHRLQIRMSVNCQEMSKLEQRNSLKRWLDGGLNHLQKRIVTNLTHVTFSPRKTYTESCAKPSRTSTLTSSPGCAFSAYRKLDTWNWKFVIQMSPWITNFLFSVIFRQKWSVGAREARQWAFCLRFISVERQCISRICFFTKQIPRIFYYVPKYNQEVQPNWANLTYLNP
jgi:hypothetical protein